jgi:hypothetical protein
MIACASPRERPAGRGTSSTLSWMRDSQLGELERPFEGANDFLLRIEPEQQSAPIGPEFIGDIREVSRQMHLA